MVPWWNPLQFSSVPISAEDPPGELDVHNRGSAEHLSYRAWLTQGLAHLSSFRPVGVRAVDNYWLKLITRFERELARLETQESQAWMKEMVRTGILWMDGLGGTIPPIPVDSGASHLY